MIKPVGPLSYYSTYTCVCEGIVGFGCAEPKTKAKKEAAYRVLEEMFYKR